MADLEQARDLLRYMTASEWKDYRDILRVFADRPLAEFTPEDISSDTGMDLATARARTQSLREWGNLETCPSMRNPKSLEDYYQRGKTYVITPSGQSVHDAVEDMISKVGKVEDLRPGSLRALQSHLEKVAELTARGEDPSDAVNEAFDAHLRFANQLRSFSAALNIWQRRYDLDTADIPKFAGVLIEYFAQRLNEINRETPRIARRFQQLEPLLAEVISQVERTGLAADLTAAGAEGQPAGRRKGSKPEDWDDMRSWFVRSRGSSEIDRITGQALTAVRTLTANLIRLTRGGSASASRRSDLLRLAGFFQQAPTPEDAHDIASAAFGLGSSRRLGYPSADVEDPHPITTSWRDAPKADVPVSLRERGDTSQRGSTTPIRDREVAQQRMRDRRRQQRADREATMSELVANAIGRVDGCRLPTASFRMLLGMIAKAAGGSFTTDGIRCDIRKEKGARTTIETTEGRLVVRDRVVTLSREAP